MIDVHTYCDFPIRMNSALLSRFDLVFVLLDNPDEEMDSMLSEHVMALHAWHSGSGSRGGSLSTSTSRRPLMVS